MSVLQKPRELLRNSAFKIKREAPTYYRSLVRSGYYAVNNFELRYEIHGAGSRTPLVTIAPFGGLACVFPSLTKCGRQLIAVEAGGRGYSTGNHRPASLEEGADDIAALLEHLRIAQADFFGESSGGIVALLITVRHPALVRRVAVYGSALGKIEEVARPDSPAEVMKPTPEHYTVQFQREAPEPTQSPTLSAKTTRRDWKGFSHQELKSIEAPVLIAAGDHDALGPRLEHHLKMSRLIPNSQLAIIPGAGHFVLNDDPEKLLPVIATFLDEPASSAPLTWFSPGW